MKTPPLVLAAATLLALLPIATGRAGEIVRPAPNFTMQGGKSLKSFLGQPVVLVIAPTPQTKEFRKEIRSLQKFYQEFAGRGTVFVAAFTQSSNGVIESNIPFATAIDGPGVAARYDAIAPISVAVIGKDGNLDLNTHKLAPAYKVRDTVLNNFQIQAEERPENMGVTR